MGVRLPIDVDNLKGFAKSQKMIHHSDLKIIIGPTLSLEKALKLATKAIALSASDPMGQAMVIDTEAEVLWKLGRINEAIESIEKAIKIKPEDNYYQSQKEKFQNSLNIQPEA